MALTADEKKKFKILEKSFGHSFGDKDFLKHALTHKSFAHENKLAPEEHNERLEFLGDAVLELAISEFLMEKFPHYSEGDLSKLRASIVNEKQLATIARMFGLGNYLYLGKGEEQTSGREKSSLLADAYEAVLGAVYLDKGFAKVSEVIRKHYSEILDNPTREISYKDYKTELQEKSQDLFNATPRYRTVSETGPDHDKVFEIEIFLRNEIMGRGRGRSKKEAEQMAANEALQKLASEKPSN